MFFAKSLVAVAAVALVDAATITIQVAQGGLTFTPNTATVAVGDTLQFNFSSGGHSVTQSTFASPCTAASPGFDSGIQTAASPAPFTVMVNDTNPIWVHCAQVGHCPAGMVFAANAATTGQETFDNFLTLAKGGSIASASGGSSSASASPAAASTAAAAGPYGGTSGASGSALNGWVVAALGFVGAAAGALL